MLCACGGINETSADISYDIPEDKQIPHDAVLNVTIASHDSCLYDENWKEWECIEDSIGGTINVNAVTLSDFGTKFLLHTRAHITE